ncbi:hypothetical protein K2173_020277 [Erythroxylum novogranatense]|uniref:Polygalacturonase n=1 Tax=Erythroxylum novogranatense TaxID=1862640 RepID=A0AAV8U7P0_9ROSI|nr:hypothetical protein K2173_020277 [Erythroxylum novogranatense]
MTILSYSLLVLIVASALPLRQTRSHAFESCVDGNAVYNVLGYGAIGDGRTDDTEAFMNAWEDACTTAACSATMLVPSDKSFQIQPVTFRGNCLSNVNFQPVEWSCHEDECREWIVFKQADGLTIHGSGTINGRGSSWWKYCREHEHEKLCNRRAAGLTIANSQNIVLSNLHFKDSPQVHIDLDASTSIHVYNITINASKRSPNTDGIHVKHCQNVSIDSSSIRTGDDCISIGDGASYMNISRIHCGPGHGISIGSLGKGGKFETVEYINVRDVVFHGATNGVRIKTWQGGRGHVRYVNFEQIRATNTDNPIIIDQYYCPYQHCHNQNDAVQVSDISYDSIFGTSRTRRAVVLDCSETVPCTNIKLRNVNLVHAKHGRTEARCVNVRGHIDGYVHPRVSCLS